MSGSQCMIEWLQSDFLSIDQYLLFRASQPANSASEDGKMEEGKGGGGSPLPVIQRLESVALIHAVVFVVN